MQRRRCACDKRFGSVNSSTTKRCPDSGLQVDSTEELLFGGFVISLCVRNQELSDDVSMLQLSGGESTLGASTSGGGAILRQVGFGEMFGSRQKAAKQLIQNAYDVNIQ